MTPSSHYAALLAQYPGPVMRLADGTLMMTRIADMTDIFPDVVKTPLHCVRVPWLDEGDPINRCFAMLGEMPDQSWPAKLESGIGTEEEASNLADMLRAGVDIDIMATWVRPAVSRAMYRIAFTGFVGAEPWRERHYHTASAIVRFIDGTYQSEAEARRALSAASKVLGDLLSRVPFANRKDFLRRFGHFMSGHETPAAVFANLLMHRPGLPTAPLSAADLAEALRFDPPIQALYRRTARTLRVGDFQLGAGEPLMCHLGCASRDSATFPNPELWDAARSGPRHTPLFFGNPKLGCPGRQIAFVIVRSLHRALPPDLQIVRNAAVAGPTWQGNDAVRACSQLTCRRAQADNIVAAE